MHEPATRPSNRPLPLHVLARPVLLAAGAAIGAYCVAVYAGFLDSAQASWLTDIAWTVFSLVAGVRCLVTARRQSSRDGRLAWSYFGAAALSWSAGMVYLMASYVLDPAFQPVPTPANYLFLGFALLAIVGFFFFRRHRPSRQVSFTRVANLGLIACTTVMVSTVLLAEPLLQTGSSIELAAFAVADPAAFASLTLFALTSLWVQDLGGLRRIGWLLFGAAALHTVGDIFYFSRVLAPGSTSFPLAPLWLAAFALQYLAAHVQDRTAADPAPAEASDAQGRPSWFEATLPAALLLVGIAVSARFEAQLTERIVILIAPLLLAFAALLALREWAMERRQAQLFRQIEESGRRSRHILAVSPAVHFVTHPFPDWATAFVPGQHAEELGLADPSMPWTERVHPEDREQVYAALGRAAGGQPATVEYRLEDPAGRHRWVHQKMILAESADGEAEIVGSLIDVSLSKRLELQVRQVQRLEALGKLSGGIAHDFNNLLTTILGYTELALHDPALPADTRANLETIQVAGRKASSLTRQLLAFSRQQTLQLGALNLNRTVQGMSELLRRLIGENIEMRVVERAPDVRVESDPGHLEQIVMNLVVNARDAMPAGGRLTIEIDTAVIEPGAAAGAAAPAPGVYGVLAVSDSGVGMSDEVQASIFEPFFSTKPQGKGTGLGLATVHGIVHQHRGFIEVSSREGEGSSFRIFLPTTDKTVATAAGSRQESLIVAGRESLLVVDDEPSISSLITQALSPAGYEILTAESGEEALAVARRHQGTIHLLLTDVVLPGISGPDLAAEIQRERPGLRVVYMSGYTDDSTLLRQVAAGEVPLERKPLRLGQLSQTIRAVLDAAPPGAAGA